jgi:hypothetical protein
LMVVVLQWIWFHFHSRLVQFILSFLRVVSGLQKGLSFLKWPSFLFLYIWFCSFFYFRFVCNFF